ncbi:dihydrolipoyl dehydrogenase [Parachlamydia acanthamoebae UV-7]|jgi:dihydrolipoamide dehydrogenase|uniref:Dihydrolipoyl dehydrogenase n=2 Tax=Parachlamydia acanthamoebae TaxID=83552 RepID=F8L2M6_PARAV|nr:dihydrolipoyl dehydrogenase [Parachlamydia acanthamoebae]CCB87554.1 dihydrolipoyl dehydrogenase [Parachlamydia acanthamoebae UV-7]
MPDTQKKFDVAVIGGGPGGYPAAIKAAQNGLSVALIEANTLGGTCLNRGCIPSKALIANAEVLQKIKDAEEFGISIGTVSFDYAKMVQRKDDVVKKVRTSLEGLIASNRITLFRGYGKFTSERTIKITGQDNLEIYADKTIIATGSEPRSIPAFPFDYKKIHDSTSLLDLTTLPKKIAIIGGGIIGCEFASLYAAFNVEVILIEMMPRILPMESGTVSGFLTKAFQKQGISIETSAMVHSIDSTEAGISVNLAGDKTITADIALVAVGRQLNTTAIGLEKTGVYVQDNGLIKVNDHMETNIAGIYAVGDIASKWWLAHVASHQGLVAGSNAAGIKATMHYNAIPSVIFTHPEIGTVGLSLEQALEAGYAATVSAFPFSALGKSQAAIQTEGFAQIVTDKKTGQILGAQVVGHDASTLVAEMGVAIANELTVESVADTIHAHPTVAEAWMEAALLANETPLHLPPKKKKQD